tara:strand:+ start:20106 stop:20324 length:219 start_codon:yes stop_codon:yes gene_type:complete
LKNKILFLVDLEEGDKFIIQGQDTTGTLLTKSEFGCLVMLDNAKGFDANGETTIKKEKTRIGAETNVRKINE